MSTATPTSASASPPSGAFFVQSAISFGVATIAVIIGIAYLPVDAWVRGFLALGMLYTVTSAFTLAKCIRDRQETTYISSRVDQARVDKLLADHDPFNSPGT